jgi:hypothetical protein
MIQFIFDHIGYFASLLPVAIMICWSIAARETKIEIPKALIASWLTSNEDNSWKLH